jgi:hypothetical protein
MGSEGGLSGGVNCGCWFDEDEGYRLGGGFGGVVGHRACG